MMARVQVSLSAHDHRRARARAAELGISFAEYVRRLVERDLGAGQRTDDVTGLFDLGETPAGDVATQKDRYVGEAADAARR